MTSNLTPDPWAAWMPVIGKSLAYLCLQEAMRKAPGDFDTVLKQVKFLQALGLSRDDAALAAGSSPASVQELQRREKNRKATRGSKKAKARAGRSRK